MTMALIICSVINPHTRSTDELTFFSDLSKELFRNVRQLYEQVDAQFTDRTPDESVGAQIAAFCVYSCGLFSTYICKYPQSESWGHAILMPSPLADMAGRSVCQDEALARDGPVMLQRIIAILRECKEVWPLAARWVEALERFSLDSQSEAPAAEGSMDYGKDPIPHAIRQLPPVPVTAPTPPQVSQHTPSLPDNAVLPRPEPQAPSALQSAPRGTLAPLLPANTNGQTLTPPSQQVQVPFHAQPHAPPQLVQQPALPQQHRRGQPLTQRHCAPHYMYLSPQPPPPPLGRQPVDGLGMLIEAFDTPQPGSATYQIGAESYYPQLGPGNDGFEGELQFYIDGAASSWMHTGAWLDTVQ